MKQIMLKIILCCLVGVFSIDAYALNARGTKKVVINNKNSIITEADAYAMFYYDVYSDSVIIASKMLEEVYIEPEYFVPEIQKTAECYAESTANAISITDFQLCYNTDLDFLCSFIDLKSKMSNLINSFEYCADTYLYMNNKTLMLDTYLDRKCGRDISPYIIDMSEPIQQTIWYQEIISWDRLFLHNINPEDTTAIQKVVEEAENERRKQKKAEEEYIKSRNECIETYYTNPNANVKKEFYKPLTSPLLK